MMIEVGTPAILEFGASQERIKSVYVGALKKRHVLFGVALTTGIKAKAREGNRVTVRYMHKGTVFGFKTEVADFRAHPSPILFLNYPITVEEMEIRGARRVDCFFPCTISAGSAAVEGLIVDISIGGCKLTFESDPNTYIPKIEAGSKIKADFYILEERNRYTLKAVLMHKKVEDDKLNLGLQFDDSDITFKSLVADYVDKVSRMLS